MKMPTYYEYVVEVIQTFLNGLDDLQRKKGDQMSKEDLIDFISMMNPSMIAALGALVGRRDDLHSPIPEAVPLMKARLEVGSFMTADGETSVAHDVVLERLLKKKGNSPKAYPKPYARR